MKQTILLLTSLSMLCPTFGQSKNLTQLKEKKPEFIQEVEIHGTAPKVIYVPIKHDGPMNHVSSTNLDDLRNILSECELIADHLYQDYGVKKILLEGCGKTIADYYKKIEGTEKKLSFEHTKMLTFKTWGNILNKERWELAFTGTAPTYGPLTILGGEYDKRIKNALSTSQKKGFFRSKEGFANNQDEFQKLLADATEGYNEKRAAILKADPMLKEEYRLTVAQRDEDFIKNITATDSTGIIMCGAGHYHDLREQLIKKGDSFMIIVPKSLKWPVKKKSEKEIYEDMLNQGAKLKNCNLTFGDGTKASIKIPID